MIGHPPARYGPEARRRLIAAALAAAAERAERERLARTKAAA